MKDEHLRMSRMLGYCLTEGTPDAWFSFSAVALVRLSDSERAALARAALDAVDESTSGRIDDGTLPPSLNSMDDARLWASNASRSELKAIALAAFEALDPSDRAAFSNHICKQEVAA